MTLYIGVDFHPHQQTVSYCNTESKVKFIRLHLFHNVEQVRAFTSNCRKRWSESKLRARHWFEQMLNDLGHELKGRQSNSDQSTRSIAS
jgi:hypothetical protein